MSFPDAGKTNLENVENDPTLENSRYIGHNKQRLTRDVGDPDMLSDVEKDNGLARLTSFPELKAVASNALSRTVSKITNRDIVDPGPAPGTTAAAWHVQ